MEKTPREKAILDFQMGRREKAIFEIAVTSCVQFSQELSIHLFACTPPHRHTDDRAFLLSKRIPYCQQILMLRAMARFRAKFAEEKMVGKKFFGGDAVGLVDLVVGWIPQWLPVFEEVADMKIFDAHRFPWLARWADSFMEVPAIKESVPDKEKMLVPVHAVKNNRLSSVTSK
ncbi:hypothetical protein ACLOJK_024792 [Asimina triloba]